jgi:hypothetical protein
VCTGGDERAFRRLVEPYVHALERLQRVLAGDQGRSDAEVDTRDRDRPPRALLEAGGGDFCVDFVHPLPGRVFAVRWSFWALTK